MLAILAAATAAVIIALIGTGQTAGAIGTFVPLGTADSYSVLAGSTVTNTGPSVISGDVGVSPGSAIVGFPPGIALGVFHAADAAADQAQLDVTTAYDDAAAQASDAAVAGDMGGLTLVGGVYTSTDSIGLTGTLTLDAQGDPDTVWIFQVGSTLTTATASQVSLVNGAQACNVFWQIGSSATLGTGSAFVGTVLALTSITATTGATIDGRLLARNGAVTLDTNVITQSACQLAPEPTTSTSTGPTSTTPADGVTTTVDAGAALTTIDAGATSAPGEASVPTSVAQPVTPPPTGSPSIPTDVTLPQTGRETHGTARAAAVLLGLGAAVAFVARRRAPSA